MQVAQPVSRLQLSANAQVEALVARSLHILWAEIAEGLLVFQLSGV
jgi:hypothetical protein